MEATPITPAAPALVPPWKQQRALMTCGNARAKALFQRSHDSARSACDPETGERYYSALSGCYEAHIVLLLAELDGYSAPQPALTAYWNGIDFEVTGTYHPAVAGDDEEPGEEAWFEVKDIFVAGRPITMALDEEVREELVEQALRRCEENARTARAARRWPDLAAEVL